MATLAREMPAEVLVGVATPTSAQTSNTGGGPSVPAATNINATGITSTQPSDKETINQLNNSSANNNSNNTISAAADSSDNQPGTPQPHLTTTNNNETNQNQHSYANHNNNNNNIYGNSGGNNAQQSSVATSNSNPLLNEMYSQNIYSQPNIDLQQLPQHLNSSQNPSYPSFLNSYEQFYQQQQQNPTETSSSSSTANQNPQQMDFINSNTSSSFPSTMPPADYKHQQQAGVRYHPYLHTPTSAGGGGGGGVAAAQNSNSNNSMDNVTNAPTAPVVSAASSSVMSPRVVSSTSPSSSSNQMQISGSASSIGSMSVGNPSSPNSAGSPQCKKCGIMCTNDSELQEHITNVHGASPYGSSGYASSPYIKEEMQQQTPPSSQNHQQLSAAGQGQTPAHAVNPGEILDLDSQKLLYSSAGGSMPAMMHATDPLHGLHSMQQRAGVNTWDQQSQEGLPPYLAQQLPNTESKNLPNHSPYYQSPKLSPYHIANTPNIIKTEYQPVIKSEYTGDTQQYLDDKSFDHTAPNQQQQQQQQQLMPPSSSPAEFPSTTTGGPQDNQQFRGGNFEPPSSSSANVPAGPLGTKAANWKSNEARRPKTYNCTACNKWFTSSGHLKRHYNTTLHKNAVKSSGQPDPATLPISVHHHPTRDPGGKSGRGRGSNAAANTNAQQQQQPPNPVQPPEPPNSPQNYGNSQVVAAAGLTPLSHYTATPSPNSMFDHHQQYQYVTQVPSTTNVSPQHTAAASMSNHHLLQNHHHQQQQQQQQQQTVLNGHPNALAGLSVPTTIYQHQMPMPSSQMRGLLNTTMPLSTAANTIHITKIEHLEAAAMEDHIQVIHEKVADEFGYLSKVEVKQEYLDEMEEKDQQYQAEHIIYSPKVEELELGKEIIQQQLQPMQVLREVEQHHHNTVITQQMQQYQLDPAQQEQQQQQQEDMDLLYHTSTTHNNNNNMPVRLPLILSHQLYQEPQLHQQLEEEEEEQHRQLHHHHQMADQDTYTLIPATPQPNTTAQQYISMPLATNMQPNNMLQLQQQLTITEQQQLPPATTTIPTTTTNMVSILPLSHHHTQQLPLSHMELQPPANMSLQLPITNINTPSHTTLTHTLTPTTTTNNIISIPSFHQLQHPDSELLQLDHMPISRPTIIGNAEIIQLQPNGQMFSSSSSSSTGQQIIQTSNGQLLRILPSVRPPATAIGSSGPTQCYSKHLSVAQKSPPAGDLPPVEEQCQKKKKKNITKKTISSLKNKDGTVSPAEETLFNDHHFGLEGANEPLEPADLLVKTQTATSKKRSRNSSSSSSSVDSNSILLPNGRIKCLICDKEFAKSCYLTQHNNSFHSGEYPYRCQKCGKRYQSEIAYIEHVDKHKTIDKDHKCVICPKQFHHKTDLRRHIDAIHTGNKQHSCHICEKSFCRRDHLRKHLETHNRVRSLAKRQQKGNSSKASTSAAAAAAATRLRKAKDTQTLKSSQAVKVSPSSSSSSSLLSSPPSSTSPSSSSVSSSSISHLNISTANPINLNNNNRALGFAPVENRPPPALPLLQQIEAAEAAENDRLLDIGLNDFTAQDIQQSANLLARQDYRNHQFGRVVQSHYNVKDYIVIEMASP